MSQVVLITGASSGFGCLISLALARAGHVVYASMRGVDGRNAAAVSYAVVDRVREEFLRRIGFGWLMRPGGKPHAA